MLTYVTTNEGKLHEAREYLDEVRGLNYEYTEIQADDLGPIAAEGAREAYRHVGGPVLVDDAGLFVEALNGFPGPYSAFVEDALGIDRVARLARDETDRRASFRCTLAYCDGEGFAASPDPIDRADRAAAAATGPDEGENRDGGGDRNESGGDEVESGDEDSESGDRASPGTDVLPVKLFEGTVRGRIVSPRGEGGFGYDPIFEHDGTTFAEMPTDRKNALSHRGRALASFAEWYADRNVG